MASCQATGLAQKITQFPNFRSKFEFPRDLLSKLSIVKGHQTKARNSITHLIYNEKIDILLEVHDSR